MIEVKCEECGNPEKYNANKGAEVTCAICTLALCEHPKIKEATKIAEATIRQKLAQKKRGRRR